MSRRSKIAVDRRLTSTHVRTIRRRGVHVVAFDRHAARQHPAPRLPREKNPLQFDCT
jgi:hypothetical protein